MDYQLDSPNPNELGARMPLSQMNSNIVVLTNPTETLKRIERHFRSQAEMPDGTIVQVGKPLMNEYGINHVMGMIHSIVNQNNIMSNITEQEKRALYLHFCDELARVLMVNRLNYEFSSERNSFSARDEVYTSSCFVVYLTLSRFTNNGERGFWSKIVQEITSITSNKQKGGGIGGLLGWNKKNEGAGA